MSDLQYQTSLFKNNTHVFITESGHTYEVYFDHDTSIFPNQEIDRFGVFLGFRCTPVLEAFKRNHDPKIGATIMFIIAVFLKANPESILSYVCSSSEGQGRHRQISFTRWYNSSHLIEEYILLKRYLGSTYCGIIYNRNHSYINKIEQVFAGFDEEIKPGVFEEETDYF